MSAEHKNKKTRFEQRSEFFEFIFSSLFISLESIEIKKNSFSNFNFNDEWTQCCDYFAGNSESIIEKIKSKLTASWSFERIGFSDKAVMISAICESEVLKTPKAVIIDQWIKVLKKYSDDESVKYVHAIIDKVI